METYNLVDATKKVIQDRRSVRNFTDEPIADQDLDMILEAARLAPSGENAQPWRFIVVKDELMRKKMGAIAGGGSSRRFTAEFVTKKMQERFANLEDEAKKQAAFQKLTTGQVSAFMAEAPVNIVVCGKKDVWDTPYDTSAAIENILLMVTALGLGACWVIAPCIDIRDEDRIKGLLGIPEEFKAVSILSIGHPARAHKPRPRMPLKELVFTEKWGQDYYEETE
ncbi:MAG: nitroreductase family protein [Anaerolineaceae bacterium]|nr:nitroreductase family protein [Anaerolineaceae bacterium]